jgi:ABC-type lipoprotein release transport system permease subunit
LTIERPCLSNVVSTSGDVRKMPASRASRVNPITALRGE